MSWCLVALMHQYDGAKTKKMNHSDSRKKLREAFMKGEEKEPANLFLPTLSLRSEIRCPSLHHETDDEVRLATYEASSRLRIFF
jgi:hypothetical protein